MTNADEPTRILTRVEQLMLRLDMRDAAYDALREFLADAPDVLTDEQMERLRDLAADAAFARRTLERYWESL